MDSKTPTKTRKKTTKDTTNPRKLTHKQQMFVKEYMVDSNATQAAIRAGYGSARAVETGYKLTHKNHIAAAIEAETAARANRLEITADRVLQELAKMAFCDTRAFFDDDGRLKPISEIDDNTAASLAGIETMHKVVGEESDGCIVLTKIKIADKGAALERLGRHLKLFTDKLDVSGELNISTLADSLRAARERRKASKK